MFLTALLLRLFCFGAILLNQHPVSKPITTGPRNPSSGVSAREQKNSRSSQKTEDDGEENRGLHHAVRGAFQLSTTHVWRKAGLHAALSNQYSWSLPAISAAGFSALTCVTHGDVLHVPTNVVFAEHRSC